MMHLQLSVLQGVQYFDLKAVSHFVTKANTHLKKLKGKARKGDREGYCLCKQGKPWVCMQSPPAARGRFPAQDCQSSQAFWAWFDAVMSTSVGACRGTIVVGEGVVWESFRASEAAGAVQVSCTSPRTSDIAKVLSSLLEQQKVAVISSS